MSWDYARNKIRLKVLPELEKVNKRTVKNINEAAKKIALADEYLTDMVKREYEKTVKKENGRYLLHIEMLQKSHEYIRSEVVKQALYECGGNYKNIGTVHIEAVLELLSLENGKQVSLPYEMNAVRAYDVIQLKKRDCEEKKEEISVIIKGAGQYNIPYTGEIFQVTIENKWENNKKNVNIEEKTYTKCFDYDKIENDLVIRTRKSGDYLVIDKEGHKQSLKSFFINEKVERDLREQILLVADGSHILWIVGYRNSEFSKVNNETKRVLKIQRIGGNGNE